MSVPYKNPVSSIVLTDVDSVLLNNTFGTNFSVYNVGGYMEVYTLNDLGYDTYGATGNIQNSGNTIPIQFYKRPVAPITDRVTLWSDAISSGRRRLGMLVYVHETETTYQYVIPNYDTLWDNAVADGCISTGATSFTVSNRVGGVETASGQALIEAWTGSTIEGQNGVTRNNARWRVFWGTDWQITGGTYDSGTGTLSLDNNTGGTINVTGFTTGSTGSQTIQQVLDTGNVSTTGMYISGATLTASTVDINGGTIDNVALGSTNPVSLVSNSVDINGGTIDNVTLGNTNPVILISNSVDINGGTIDNVTLGNTNPVILISNSVDINGGTIDNTTIGAQVRSTGAFTYIYDNNGLTGNTGQILSTSTTGITWIDSSSTDYYVTGGTLSAQGELTLTRNDGNSIEITGFTAQESDTYVTGATYTESTGILTLTRNDGNTVGAGGWSYIKSITESNNNLTVTDNAGNASLIGIDAITGLGYNDWGLTGTTSGTLFYLGTELPFITGGTYSNGTITLGINGVIESDITITGIDADDTYLTGATYNPTTLTLGMSDGTDVSVSGFAPEITGGTYNNGTLSLEDNVGGSVDITGITFSSTNIYSNDGQLSANRVVDQNSNSLTFSGGSVSMGTGTTSPVCAILELASTTQGLLIPRMTQVERLAINTPLPGLLVYCTNSDSNGAEGMYMYKSSGWVNVL